MRVWASGIDDEIERLGRRSDVDLSCPGEVETSLQWYPDEESKTMRQSSSTNVVLRGINFQDHHGIVSLDLLERTEVAYLP